MQQLLALRKETTREQGAAALDAVIPRYACRRCETEVRDPALRTIGQVAYRSLGGLVEQAREVCAQVVRANAPACPACGATAAVRHVDYHAFHSALGRDLVVRRIPAGLLGRTRQALFWWDPETGFQPLAALDETQARALTRDALLRNIALWLARADTREAIEAIAEAAEFLAGDRALLEFIPFLLSSEGATGLAGGIAEAHVARRPEDPEGHYWLGGVVLDLVSRGVWAPSRLDEARLRLGEALRLDPEHPRAGGALERLAELAGRADEADAKQA